MAASSMPSILNFRDVGQTVNKYTGRQLMVEGILFRSARPDEASKHDRRTLINNFGIRNILDLRTKTEHIEQAQKRDARVRRSTLMPQSDQTVVEPLQIPGIAYHLVNFNGSAFSRQLISQLSWWDFGKLLGLMAFGHRLEAISILGANVMQPQGLVGLATTSLDVCKREVAQVFGILSEPTNFPLLVHCTQGKDRTGLVVMLCLFLLRCPVETIHHDYMLSEKELESERETRLQEIQLIGLGKEFGECHPDMVTAVHRHIGEHYGSLENYLESCGISAEKQNSVRETLGSARRVD